jgi:hypothetical protein
VQDPCIYVYFSSQVLMGLVVGVLAYEAAYQGQLLI